MKTIIYYFSGTGNSLHIARELANSLPDCQLRPVAAYLHHTKVSAGAESVGFVFPLYFWGVPLIMRNFIKRLDLDIPSYFFALITCGIPRGRALYDLNTMLEKKGKKLNSGYYITMGSNYIKLFNLRSPSTMERYFRKAAEKISGIAETICNKEDKGKRDGFFSRLIGGILQFYWRKRVASSDRKFHVDENCNSCGICFQVCPVNNISMIEGIPEWGHHCQECMACIHLCPEQAIQYGKRTQHKKRYRHPQVQIKDIIRQKTFPID
ncbi:EFR1 family ferrodoxin [bacterium]|nr:EFR1 family ferrodoxin [bacterium]